MLNSPTGQLVMFTFLVHYGFPIEYCDRIARDLQQNLAGGSIHPNVVPMVSPLALGLICILLS